MSHLAVKVSIGAALTLEAEGDDDRVVALYVSFMAQIKESVAELTKVSEAMAAAKRGEVSH